MRKLALIAGIALLALAFSACPTEPEALPPGINPDNFPPRPSNPPGHIGEAPSLGYIWARYFPMGNIVAAATYNWQGPIGGGHVADIGNDMREHLLRRHFAILTAENAMKPDQLQPSAGVFPFANNPNNSANRIAAFANNSSYPMRLHGHVLVWHSQSPSHLNQTGSDPLPRDEAISNLRTHIKTVMRHFGTSVESWEVLNEIFASSVGAGSGPLPVTADNWRMHLRGRGAGASGWFDAIGSDPNGDCFIWLAFTTARRVADEMGRPDMILYYNDYNEEQPNKRNAIYFMVREMNQRFAAENGGRRLIDAIGMQAHYHRSGQGSAFPWGPTNLDNVSASMERFSRLIDDGLLRYISITELDVTVGGAPGDRFAPNPPLTAEQEMEQAIMYARLFRIFRDFADANPGWLRRVSLWGINDNASWRWRGSPVLWDSNLRPKKAFWAAAHPDGFLLPNGDPRPVAEINAFLANPRDFIDERHW